MATFFLSTRYVDWLSVVFIFFVSLGHTASDEERDVLTSRESPLAIPPSQRIDKSTHSLPLFSRSQTMFSSAFSLSLFPTTQETGIPCFQLPPLSLKKNSPGFSSTPAGSSQESIHQSSHNRTPPFEDEGSLRRLVEPIIIRWDLPDTDPIQPFITLAFTLRQDLTDEQIKKLILLGDQYIQAVKPTRLSRQDVLTLLTTLGNIDKEYPKSDEPSFSAFTYRTMIAHHHNHKLFLRLEQQIAFLWHAAYVFNKTGEDPHQATTILQYTPWWVKPWHYCHLAHTISDLISDIIELAPHNHSDLLSAGVRVSQDHPFFDSLSFLRGVHLGLQSVCDRTVAPSASRSPGAEPRGRRHSSSSASSEEGGVKTQAFSRQGAKRRKDSQ